MKNELTKSQRSELEACEAKIEAGMETFVEVGNALLTIREGKLYRTEFKTFEEYCQTKWEMSDRHARRLIVAAEVAGNITGPRGPEIPPTSEKQVRPLVNLPAEQQQEAWTVATASAGGKQPTAKQVQAAVGVVKAEKTFPPIPTTEFTQNQEEEIRAAESDPDDLKTLKLRWRDASKKSRKAFAEWIKTNP